MSTVNVLLFIFCVMLIWVGCVIIAHLPIMAILGVLAVVFWPKRKKKTAYN